MENICYYYYYIRDLKQSLVAEYKRIQRVAEYKRPYNMECRERGFQVRGGIPYTSRM